MNENIQTIKIDVDGKYIIVIEIKDIRERDSLSEALGFIEDQLNTWWESDEKFIVLPVYGDIKIRFERLKNE